MTTSQPDPAPRSPDRSTTASPSAPGVPAARTPGADEAVAADWIPPEVDTTQPAVARLYDYLLGGAHNFAADRDAARRAIAVLPDLPGIARANRSFLNRAVRYMASQGVDQFLDLGSGIPTRGNVHEIARASNRDAVTVYVDVDPVAIAHARLLLRDDPRAAALQADLRDPDTVLAHPTVARLIDWTRPVGLLAVAVLHFVPDSDDPTGILASYRRAMAPGSHVALSHATHEDSTGDESTAVNGAAESYRQARQPVVFRTREELRALLAGFVLVDPGVVPIPDWRPPVGDLTRDRIRVPGLAAVARVDPPVGG